MNDGEYLSAYTSPGAFLSYKFNSWDKVATANSADLALNVSSDYLAPRNGSLINDKGTIYIITHRARVGFASEAVFKGLGYLVT